MNNETLARFEFKYVLDPLTAMRVRDFVESVGLSPDTHTATNPYTVTSLYFDTFGLDDYYDKAAGIIDRKKIRIRAYADTLHDMVEVFFEVKNKHDAFISKDRAVVSEKQWHEIVENGFSGLSSLFDYHVLHEGRIPTVIIRYMREAFEDRFYGRVRLTLDSDIEAIRPRPDLAEKGAWYDTSSVSGPVTVLEIKFSERLPWWFSFMARKFDLERSAYSKYAHAIDALYRYDPLPR